MLILEESNDDATELASAAAIARAEVDVANAEEALEDARLVLANTALVAPITGTVTAVKADAGEAVGATPASPWPRSISRSSASNRHTAAH